MPNEIPILSGTELKITDFSLQTERVYSYPIHGHDYYEILIYDPFDGEIAVNGHTFHTEAPTAVLVTPKDFHSTTVFGSTEARCCKLQIAGETFEKHFAHPFVPIVTQEREQVAFLRMLVSQSDANRGNQELFTRCIELVVLSMQNSMEMLPRHSKSTALVSRATEMINRGFREAMTLKSVAAALYVSPQYLSEVFSRYAEMSFTEYLIRRRLAYAAGLLKNGAGVTEACFASGYRNLSHFQRAFKKQYQQTPYRFGRGEK